MEIALPVPFTESYDDLLLALWGPCQCIGSSATEWGISVGLRIVR